MRGARVYGAHACNSTRLIINFDRWRPPCSSFSVSPHHRRVNTFYSPAPNRMLKGKTFQVIVAQCASRGIGRDNNIPWHLPSDLKRFRKITSECVEGKQNVVIMGRRTYESLPANYRPLPNRVNIVLSRDESIRSRLAIPPSVLIARSLDEVENVIQAANLSNAVDNLFVIGGEALYAEAIKSPLCAGILLTHIEAHFDCDKVTDPLDDVLFSSSINSFSL